MMVNSPIEIYSTVIGAKLYDDIFNIMVSYGILYIPLIAIFVQAIKAYCECPHGGGTDNSLRNLMLNLTCYILVVMLAVVPTKKLDVKSIGYRPSCAPTATPSKFGETGTTYDVVFQKQKFEDIKLPVLLTFVLEGASGFTNAAISSLSCKIDVQKIQGVINTTVLSLELQNETKRFNKECYVKSKTQFDANKPDKNKDSNIYSRYITNHKKYGGDSDLAWAGSHILQDIYYSEIYPVEPVPPFDYSLYRDFDIDRAYNAGKIEQLPIYGYPSCYAWWNDQKDGLKFRILEAAQNNSPNNKYLGRYDLTEEVKTWRQSFVDLFSSSPSKLRDESSPEDIIVRSVLVNGNNGGFGNNYEGWVNNDGLGGNEHTDSISPIVGLVSGVLGQADTIYQAGRASVKRYEMTQEIPIVQAILVVLLLALGPIILVMGKLEVNVIVSYYFMLASTKFIPFLIKMVNFLELSIHESMGYGVYATEQYAMLYKCFTTFYYLIPFIYLMLMSLAGIQVGHSVASFMSSPASIGTSAAGGKLAKVTSRALKR